jgi:hypothetical protein
LLIHKRYVKIITIKLTIVNNDAGPFNLLMGWQCYSWKCFKKTLSTGISYIVDNTVTLITLTSIGKCKLSKTLSVSTITNNVYALKQKNNYTSCLWRHLT